MEKFVVKRYTSEDRPTIKGNGFDGLEVGESREEAQAFVDFVNAAVAAERERCIAALRALEDRSGVNDDGRAWLVRLTREDCVAALLALGPNVGVEPPYSVGSNDGLGSTRQL